MIPAPSLITRSQWGAKTATGRIVNMSAYTHVVIHHAAGHLANTTAQGKRQVKLIQNHHQDNNEWIDIGYHFLIDSQGQLYQGLTFTNPKPVAKKPGLALGAHVSSKNKGKIGVCLLGCFHPPEPTPCNDVLAPAAINGAVNTLAFLCHAYDISGDNIKGHRDYKKTACPGDKIYSKLSTIRDRVKRLL